MSEPQNKAEVLAAFAEARAAHEAFLATIPADRWLVPGATGPWTCKDVIAHLAGWRARTLARLEAAERGAPPPPSPWPTDLDDAGDDAINAWIYTANRDRPLADVLAEWRASFDRIAALLAALPEADLFDPARFPWMEGESLASGAAGGFLGHFHDEHEPALRAWLDGAGP